MNRLQLPLLRNINWNKKASLNDICVEVKDSKKLSFMTPKAFELLQKIVNLCLFIPVTTRSIEQYRRISILQGKKPEYALVSNGAVLLVNGEIDSKWQKATDEILKDCKLDIVKYIEILKNDPNTNFDVRHVDDAFLFTKSSCFQKTLSLLEKTVDLNKFVVCNIIDKIYVIPRDLNKGFALWRFIKDYCDDYLITAGDSLLDLPMLEIADKAFVPSDYAFYNEKFSYSTDENFSEYLLENVYNFCKIKNAEGNFI